MEWERRSGHGMRKAFGQESDSGHGKGKTFSAWKGFWPWKGNGVLGIESAVSTIPSLRALKCFCIAWNELR